MYTAAASQVFKLRSVQEGYLTPNFCYVFQKPPAIFQMDMIVRNRLIREVGLWPKGSRLPQTSIAKAPLQSQYDFFIWGHRLCC